MYTSDMETNRKRALKTAFVYFLITLFCLLLGAVYEYFSHGVFSYAMIYAFAFPLLLCVFPFFLMGTFGVKVYPAPIILGYHHCAVATLTLGSLVYGALEIYGTTNSLVTYYFVVGAALLIAEVTTYIVQRLFLK